MNLLLGQLDPRVYQVADPVEESLSGVRCLNITDSSFLEETRTSSRKAVLMNTMGA